MNNCADVDITHSFTFTHTHVHTHAVAISLAKRLAPISVTTLVACGVVGNCECKHKMVFWVDSVLLLRSCTLRCMVERRRVEVDVYVYVPKECENERGLLPGCTWCLRVMLHHQKISSKILLWERERERAREGTCHSQQHYIYTIGFNVMQWNANVSGRVRMLEWALSVATGDTISYGSELNTWPGIRDCVDRLKREMYDREGGEMEFCLCACVMRIECQNVAQIQLTNYIIIIIIILFMCV